VDKLVLVSLASSSVSYHDAKDAEKVVKIVVKPRGQEVNTGRLLCLSPLAL
jgi:hypothetical protein